MNELLDRLQLALGDAFRIEEEMPAGGMSRLFIAMEASLNRRVVIKVLPPEFTSEISAARFKQEVEVAARLQHPHILPVLAAGAREGLLYYVMPFVSGESLRHRMLRERRLPVADALRILAEIADALSMAHSLGIVHRDIKPENILLEGRHAVLADFGIARALAQSRTGGALTSTGTSVGTPGYMSPEQLAGDIVDASSDVYALAVVGYEMLAGVPPFQGGSAQALLAAHLTATPVPLRSIREEIPRAVSDAMARALAKNPGERFASAAAFAEALDPAAHGDHRDAAPAAPRAAGVRRRVALLGGTLALLAIVAAVMLVRRGRVDAALAARVAVLADSGKLDDIVAVLAGAPLDDDRLAASARKFVGRLRLGATASSADVTLTRTTPFAGFATRPAAWRGAPGGAVLTLVAGEYLLRAPLTGNDTLQLLLTVLPGAELAVAPDTPPADSASVGMRVGSAGRAPTGTTVEPFLIDRSEVSNEEYQRFVAAGAYRNEHVWPATMQIDGVAMSRAQALARFVDRSGLSGPRTWTSGRFPDGQATNPVVGVTWYEAAAYAAWVGKSLPTAAQWWRAALGDGGATYPWGRDGASVEVRANLEGTATRGRGSMPLGVSPFGCEHMAGNAREWLADSTAGAARRIVVGGSWQDPSYMFERSHAESFFPGFTNDAIGFRLVRPLGRR